MSYGGRMLALTARSPEAHGGSVRATSSVGAATEVAVFFPDAKLVDTDDE
jgi:hypothetical protein